MVVPTSSGRCDHPDLRRAQRAGPRRRPHVPAPAPRRRGRGRGDPRAGARRRARRRRAAAPPGRRRLIASPLVPSAPPATRHGRAVLGPRSDASLRFDHGAGNHRRTPVTGRPEPPSLPRRSASRRPTGQRSTGKVRRVRSSAPQVLERPGVERAHPRVHRRRRAGPSTSPGRRVRAQAARRPASPTRPAAGHRSGSPPWSPAPSSPPCPSMLRRPGRPHRRRLGLRPRRRLRARPHRRDRRRRRPPQHHRGRGPGPPR